MHQFDITARVFDPDDSANDCDVDCPLDSDFFAVASVFAAVFEVVSSLARISLILRKALKV